MILTYGRLGSHYPPAPITPAQRFAGDTAGAKVTAEQARLREPAEYISARIPTVLQCSSNVRNLKVPGQRPHYIYRMFATPSCLAISSKFSGALLKRCVEVREITFRSAIFESRVRISS